MQTRGLLQTITESAMRPCDVASLLFFRVAFGLTLLWEAVRYFLIGWVDSLYLLPRFHFTYLGFGWVRPWPGDGLVLHFVALGVAALFLTLGLWTRTSAALLCFGWGYVLLLDKAAYLNHFYLICLLSWLLVFVPANSLLSMDVRHRPDRRSESVPTLALWVLRAQIAIPYFYGALAKLNGDWLQGQPLQMWMSRMTHVREYLPAFGELWLAVLLSYGGFLLDLLVIPCLLWRRTRMWAFVIAVVFHLANSVMFHTGIFPWLMICATTLFFDPDWPRRVMRLKSRSAPVDFENNITRQRAYTGPETAPKKHRPLFVCVGMWFFIQGILPFQHLLYPGDVDWTEEGSRFSWRMMLCDKAAAMRVVAIDRQTREIHAVDPSLYLTYWQLNYLSYDPDLLVQFSRFLAQEIRETLGADVEIHIQDFCSLNGRRPQLLVDPEIDLASQSRRWGHQPWILPLKGDIPEKLWDQPPETWMRGLELSDPKPVNRRSLDQTDSNAPP